MASKPLYNNQDPENQLMIKGSFRGILRANDARLVITEITLDYDGDLPENFRVQFGETPANE